MRNGKAQKIPSHRFGVIKAGYKGLDVQLTSTSLLKFCRYLSTRRETAPPKLEVSLKVTHVVRSGHDVKETTPAAKWSGA